MEKFYCPLHNSIIGEEHTINFKTSKKYKNAGIVKGWLCKECNKLYVKSNQLDTGILGKTKSGHIIENIYVIHHLPKKFYVYKKRGTQIPCGCKQIKLINEYTLADKSTIQIPTKYCEQCNKYYITIGTYEQCRKYIESNNIEVIFIDGHELNYNEKASLKEIEIIDEIRDEEVMLNNEKMKPANKIAQAYLNSKIKYNPYQYLPWLYLFNEEKKNILICDEVGLGKTIEAGILIKEKIYEDKNNHILVICPAFLRNKWKNELEDKFDLESIIFDKNNIDVASNIMILPLSKLNQFNEFCKQNFDLIIIDEAHYFKNNNSARYKYLSTLLEKQSYENLVLMTATPINNTENDYYSIKKLLGNDFAKTSTTKKQAYINLPKRNIKEIYVSLNLDEQNIYDTTDILPAFSGTIYRHIGASCIYALIKYVMISNNPSSEFKDELQFVLEELIDEEYVLEEDITLFKEKILSMKLSSEDSKFNKLVEIISEMSESKIVIFSHYIETVKYLQSELSKQFRCEYIYGNNFSNKSVYTNKKNRFIDAKKWFDEQDEQQKTILICSDSCKEGIDLDSASCLINYDLPFNPSILEQRIGRIDRMSQKKNMNIYNFHVEDTYDDRLHMILSSKLLCINYYAEYGIGNPLAITKNAESPFDRFIRYFKKHNDLKMSNDDFSVLKRILRKINVKTNSNISQLEILNLLSENKKEIVELFDDEEFEQMTDDQLIIQREILNKKLNFPSKKNGQLNLNNESKIEILEKVNKDASFRKKVSCLITDYENKLKQMEITGEPMSIKLDDLKSSLCFTTDVQIEGTFIPNEMVDELQKKGVDIIWD